MSGSNTTSPSNAPPRAEAPRWWSAVLTAVCRCLLAAVFLAAAVSKISDPESFQERVRGAYLPPALTTVVLVILPWLELTCGACLALGYAVREAALLVCVLLALFTVHSLLNHTEPDCGCFLMPLPQPEAAWWPALRNAVLLACGVRVLGATHFAAKRTQ
jgi:putative oxidoreductase